jgi:polar amino acid transport system substrate-binding protein
MKRKETTMSIWKTICGVSAAAALSFAVLGATTPDANAQELELLEQGKLKCAFTGAFAPFSMQTPDGNWIGLTNEVFAEMAKRTGLEIEHVITKWESLLVGLMAGHYDILCDTMDITKERQERVLFVDGWLESGGRLVVHADSPIESQADFKGKVMGVLVSSTWAELAKGLEPSDTKYYQAESDAFRDLADEKIDGMITDSIAAAYGIENSGLPLKIVPGYLSRIQKGFATQLNRVNLAKALNEALATMIADGTYEKITGAILGYSPAPEEPIKSQFR